MTQSIVPVAEGLFPGTSLARSGEKEWRKGEDGRPFIAAIQTFQVHHALTMVGFTFQMAGYSPISTRTFILLHFVPATTATAVTLADQHYILKPVTRAIYDNIGDFCKSATIAACIAQMYMGAYARPLACISVLALDYAVKGAHLPEKASDLLHHFDLHEVYCRTHTLSAIIAGTANSNYFYTLLGTTSLCAWLIRLYRNRIADSTTGERSQPEHQLTRELLDELMSDSPPELELNPDYTSEIPLPQVDSKIDFCMLSELFNKITWNEKNFDTLVAHLSANPRIQSTPVHSKLYEYLNKYLTDGSRKHKEWIIRYVHDCFEKHLRKILMGEILCKHPSLLGKLRTRLRSFVASMCSDPMDSSSVNLENQKTIDQLIILAVDPVGFCDAQILSVAQNMQGTMSSGDLRTDFLTFLQVYRTELFHELLTSHIPNPKETNFWFLKKIYGWMRHQLSLTHVHNFLTNLLGRNCDLHNLGANADSSASIGPILELFAAFFLEPRMRDTFQKRHTAAAVIQVIRESLTTESSESFKSFQKWWSEWINTYADEDKDALEKGLNGEGGEFGIDYELFGHPYIDEKSSEVQPWVVKAMLFDMGILRLAGSDAVEAPLETADGVQREEQGEAPRDTQA